MKEIPNSTKRGFCRKIENGEVKYLIFDDGIAFDVDGKSCPVDDKCEWIEAWSGQTYYELSNSLFVKNIKDHGLEWYASAPIINNWINQ